MVATIGSDATGQAYNINADTAAGAIAEALEAEKLVYLTDVDGIRPTTHDPASLLSQLRTGDWRLMMTTARSRAGMIPKVRSCLRGRQRRGRRRPTSSTAGAPRPAARDFHPRGDRHHGDAACVTDGTS